MAGRIRQSDVDEVKARTNIADIVGDHVSSSLRAWVRSRASAPSTTSAAPASTCARSSGYYHCFGCGESRRRHQLPPAHGPRHLQRGRRAARRPASASSCTTRDGGAGVRPGQPRTPARGATRPPPSSSSSSWAARSRGRTALPRRARLRCRRRSRTSASASPRRLGRAHSPPQGSRASPTASSWHPASLAGRPRPLRPLPRTPGVADPRRHRPDRRVRRPQAARRRQGPEVPEHPRDRRSTARRRCSTGSTSPSAISQQGRRSSSRATPTSWRATSRASRPRSRRAEPRSASTTSRCCGACSATTPASVRSSSPSTATPPARRRRCARSPTSSVSPRRRSSRSRPTGSTRATCD